MRISRIDGQTRKIENRDYLPEEHLWGTIFENVIVIFLECIVSEKFAKNEKSRFYLIKYAKIIGKIGKVLDICISTICDGLKRNKLRIIALPFLYQAIVFFSFVRHLCWFSRLLKYCYIDRFGKRQKLRNFRGLKCILVCPISGPNEH